MEGFNPAIGALDRRGRGGRTTIDGGGVRERETNDLAGAVAWRMPTREDFNPVGGTLDRRGKTTADDELDRGGRTTTDGGDVRERERDGRFDQRGGVEGGC